MLSVAGVAQAEQYEVVLHLTWRWLFGVPVTLAVQELCCSVTVLYIADQWQKLFWNHLCDFLEEKWTNYEISCGATPDYHFKLLQCYLNKCMWSFCGPHLTNVGVSSTREYDTGFIWVQHIVKPVVLLFHFIDYQIRKILTGVKVRSVQFFVMLQLVGIPFQGYSQCSKDTFLRNFSLPQNFSSTALPMCKNCRHGLHHSLHCHGNSSGCWGPKNL